MPIAFRSRARVTLAAQSLLIAAAAACASGKPNTSKTEANLVTGRGVYPRDYATLKPQTRAERSGFTETSLHADVMMFLDSLQKMGAKITITTMGTTSMGKPIPLVIASRPLVKTAGEAKRLNRPIVYIQGNIHGGEVEGKEAVLALLRELTMDKKPNVLDSIVLMVAPIYNADGNDKLGPQARNRREQNGPAMVGERANGQGLDLNRDYIKAEAPETRASLAMFQLWDPDLLVDLHTTDGSYHGYALTYSPPLNPAAKVTGPFLRDTVLPAVKDLVKRRYNMDIFDYGNFEPNQAEPKSWNTYEDFPRYGTNYYGVRGRAAILSEAYSHDPFRARVAATYTFLWEVLNVVASNPEDFVDGSRESDRRMTAWGNTPGTSPTIALRSVIASKRSQDVIIEDIACTAGDTTILEPGTRGGCKRQGKFRTVHLPVYDRFSPTRERRLPYAWTFDASQTGLVALLEAHGVFLEKLDEGTSLRSERFTVDSLVKGQAFQKHTLMRLEGRWLEVSPNLAGGTIVVRAGQPLAALAQYILDPESDDGAATWNVLDASLTQGGTYPVTRVLEPIHAALTPLRPIR